MERQMEMNIWSCRFLGLLLCLSCVTAMNLPCEPYPSLDYKDVGLKCSGLKVKEMPKRPPTSLKLLHLTATAISSLDNTTFQGRDLTELTTLSVTGGKLTSVGADAFCSLPALWKLDLSHNNLQRLDASSFRCNKQLKIVDLSHNPSLRHLPLLDSSSIETMYIENSNLTSIDIDEVKGMTTLKTLSLSSNRNLNCLSEKKRLERALRDLLVICEDSIEYHRPDPPIGGREPPPLNSPNNTESTTHLITKDAENVASHFQQPVWTMLVVAVFVFTISRICNVYNLSI